MLVKYLQSLIILVLLLGFYYIAKNKKNKKVLVQPIITVNLKIINSSQQKIY